MTPGSGLTLRRLLPADKRCQTMIMEPRETVTVSRGGGRGDNLGCRVGVCLAESDPFMSEEGARGQSVGLMGILLPSLPSLWSAGARPHARPRVMMTLHIMLCMWPLDVRH